MESWGEHRARPPVGCSTESIKTDLYCVGPLVVFFYRKEFATSKGGEFVCIQHGIGLLWASTNQIRC